MWSPGNCQPGHQVEAVQPILSQRKRSIDLVRQAQFAACSYLGFDPYEEKHKIGLVHQVSSSDGSIPVELHLHHHHHHHCRENEEVLKRPSHMSANADSPLGVGSLLSICDHIQMFQDAWQGHSKVDERSQKFMLHGSLIKRDSGFAGFEGGLPSNNDKKEKPRERSFPSSCADRYWNGGMAAAGPAISQPVVAGSNNHHINTAARISHWECSVVQEEKLTKGFGVRIEPSERGRPMDTSDLMAASVDFGWTPSSKHSTHMAPICNGAKVERAFLTQTGDASMSSVRSSQDSFSGSNRKFGSAVTKRKKSFSDVDMGDDQMFSCSSDALSRPCMDTKTINHLRPVQMACTSSKKMQGLSMTNVEGQHPTRGSASQEGCYSQGCETGAPKFELISSRIGKVDAAPPKKGTMLNCDECTCQQSLPTPRPSSSYEEKQEGMGVRMSVHGLIKDFKGDLDFSNAASKQYDLSEKIIGLDESENGDAHSPQFVRNRQDKSLLRRSNPVLAGKDAASLAASTIKHKNTLDH